MSSLIKDFIDRLRGPTPEQMESVANFFNPPAPEPEETLPEPETFTQHIKENGFPRFLSYQGERNDN